jgi:hypothetical protein
MSLDLLEIVRRELRALATTRCQHPQERYRPRAERLPDKCTLRLASLVTTWQQPVLSDRTRSAAGQTQSWLTRRSVISDTVTSSNIGRSRSMPCG